MTKATVPTENSKKQSDNIRRPPKFRLHNDCRSSLGRSVGVTISRLCTKEGPQSLCIDFFWWRLNAVCRRQLKHLLFCSRRQLGISTVINSCQHWVSNPVPPTYEADAIPK